MSYFYNDFLWTIVGKVVKRIITSLLSHFIWTIIYGLSIKINTNLI